MPEWFLVVAAIVALGGSIFSAVNGFRTWKKTSPVEEVRKEIDEKWQNFYKGKWDSLKNNVDNLSKKIEVFSGIENNTDCMKLLLRSMMLLIEHEITDNHIDKLKEAASNINDFLLENL